MTINNAKEHYLKVWLIVCGLIFHILLTKDLPFTKDDILARTLIELSAMDLMEFYPKCYFFVMIP